MPEQDPRSIEPSPAWPAVDFPRSGRDALSMLTEPPPEDIFREYDLRGLVDAPFGFDASRITPFTASVLGRAFGTYLAEEGVDAVVVGYDSRAYSPLLAGALAEGLLSTGRHVVATGLGTTPMVYFAQHELGVPGAVSVTASHNPNGWGGFKLSLAPSTTLGPEEVERLHRIVLSGEFARGTGSYVERSVTESYVAKLADLNPAVAGGLDIVVDGANSVSGVVAAAALARAGHRVRTINAELDWSFPNHEPDPELVEGRRQLAAAVVEAGADLGIAIDGDGDRLGVSDEHGATVLSDRTLAIIAGDVLERHPGATIVYDVKCSRLVDDVVRDAGGEPVMWMTGHSHVKAKMAELGAEFAGERSGHFFDAADYLGYDDAVHAALRVARIVDAAGRPFSALVGDLPHYESSPTMQARCADAAKYGVVERIAERGEAELAPREMVRVNGARFEFDDGWFLIRASSNLPALVIVCEGETTEDLDRMYRAARALLDAEPEVDPDWENDLHGGGISEGA